jgi:hypothetical protein
MSPWRLRVGSAEGTILGEGVWCLADIEVSSAKTEAHNCLKNTIYINKSAKVTKKSVNQLNLKGA